MVSTRIQLIAISVLASANVWLAWWDVRLLTYSQTVSKAIPGASSYSGLDPILEVPAVFVLARIHRRYDVTAAEWAMRGKRRRWSGHDFWQLGPVSVFSRRGETL